MCAKDSHRAAARFGPHFRPSFPNPTLRQLSLWPPIKPSNMAPSCTEVSSRISALVTALRPITRSRVRLQNGAAQRRCISQASTRQQYGASSAMDTRQAEAAKKNTSTLLVQSRFCTDKWLSQCFPQILWDQRRNCYTCAGVRLCSNVQDGTV